MTTLLTFKQPQKIVLIPIRRLSKSIKDYKRQRAAMVESVLIEGLEQVEAAAKYNLTPQIVQKWIKRFKSDGEAGLQDRLSRLHNSPNATSPERVSENVNLRVEGKLTGDYIARKFGIHQITVSRVLVRVGVCRKKDIEES